MGLQSLIARKKDRGQTAVLCLGETSWKLRQPSLKLNKVLSIHGVGSVGAAGTKGLEQGDRELGESWDS